MEEILAQIHNEKFMSKDAKRKKKEMKNFVNMAKFTSILAVSMGFLYVTFSMIFR